MTKNQLQKIFVTDLNYSANTLIQPKEVKAIALDNDSVVFINPDTKIKFVNNWTIMEVYNIKKDGKFNEDKPDVYIATSGIFEISMDF